MPRRKKNKSEAIRQAVAQFPEAGPTAIAKHLKGKGISVSVPMVSNVKSRMGRPATEQQREPAKSGTISLPALLGARRLIEEAGSVEAAQAALDAVVSLSA